MPLEECSSGAPQIGVFNTSNMGFVGKAPLVRSDAPWAAINPKDGKLYTSGFNPNSSVLRMAQRLRMAGSCRRPV